jgi:cytochrome c556
MRRVTIISAGLLAASAHLATAQDVIWTRQMLMDNNGGAAAISGGMRKGEIPYDPTVARAALLAFRATGAAYGDYFPEGSEDPEKSYAAPAIWTDRAGFDEVLATFRERAVAAVDAAGKEGPVDLAAFQSFVSPVLEMCRTCHEGYRIDN